MSHGDQILTLKVNGKVPAQLDFYRIEGICESCTR